MLGGTLRHAVCCMVRLNSNPILKIALLVCFQFDAVECNNFVFFLWLLLVICCLFMELWCYLANVQRYL